MRNPHFRQRGILTTRAMFLNGMHSGVVQLIIICMPNHARLLLSCVCGYLNMIAHHPDRCWPAIQAPPQIAWNEYLSIIFHHLD